MVRSLHLRGLSEAGASRLAALEEADRQLDRIARLLHDALQGGVSMSEIARVTGVSRQTLYELRGRYGDTADLRLAVLQALLTQRLADEAGLARRVGRPEREVKGVLAELEKESFIETRPPLDDDDAGPYVVTLDGYRALQHWTLLDDPAGGKPWGDL
jgi:DNA-binding phage protein